MVHSNSRQTDTSLVLLPPSRQSAAGAFRNIALNTRWHDDLLAGVQRFRGSIYSADGAIGKEDLTSDGRHKSPADDHSWHVLSLNRDGRICACLRYLDERHARRFDDLFVRHAAVSRTPAGTRFRAAVEDEMARARQMRMGFGEVGGWAVAEDYRGTFEPLRIILATYGLLEVLGGCLGVATATFRHSSASILRRIGLTSLVSSGEELPPYFDPHYNCQMEMLRFDSRIPNPRYSDRVSAFAHELTSTTVVCRESIRTVLEDALHTFDLPVAAPSLQPIAA
jgi:hypothetical protein